MDDEPAIDPRLQELEVAFNHWCDQRDHDLEAAHAVREPLFHYTDMAGLLGIMRTEAMWFTNVLHLNDPSEFSFGLDLAIGILRQEAAVADPAVKAFCAWMEHLLIKAGGEIFGVFVASFSRAGNDLDQWRAYADNGRGVSIGLAPKLFEAEDATALGVAEKTIVGRVCYDASSCRADLLSVIRQAIGAISNSNALATNSSERKMFGKRIANRLAAPVFALAITSKHPAYAHEAENRLFLMNDYEKLGPLIELRTRGASLIPYISSRLSVRAAGAITKITIGPAADERSEDAVRALLRRYDLPLDLVEKSEIPYSAR